MRDQFEVRSWDAAGRLGDLTVPRAGVTVRTPALMPVINPNIRTIPPADLESPLGEEILTTNAYIIEALIITAAISLLMSRVIIGELRKLELKQRESADDAPPSSTVLTRCGATCTLIQFYLILDLGYDLPDLDELLLWASRDPNPHRPRLREQVESGRFW